MIASLIVPENSRYKAQVDSFDDQAVGVKQRGDLSRVFPICKP